jgi:hypothetical protein
VNQFLNSFDPFWHGNSNFWCFSSEHSFFKTIDKISIKIVNFVESFGENLFNVLVSFCIPQFASFTHTQPFSFYHKTKLTNTFNEIFLKKILIMCTFLKKTYSMVNFIFRKYVEWTIKNYYPFSVEQEKNQKNLVGKMTVDFDVGSEKKWLIKLI